jgi:hypothetical protein
MFDPVLDLIGLVAKITCRCNNDGTECFAHDESGPSVRLMVS